MKYLIDIDNLEDLNSVSDLCEFLMTLGWAVEILKSSSEVGTVTNESHTSVMVL